MELMSQQQLYTGSCRLSGFATHTYPHIHCDMKSRAPNGSALCVFVSVHVFTRVSDHHGLAHTQPKKTTVTQTSTSPSRWPGESRGGLLIARQIARALFFFPASRSLQPRCPRNLLFWRARGAEEVTVQARGLQEEVVTRDIWLPAFYYCTGCVYMCVLERGSVRAI